MQGAVRHPAKAAAIHNVSNFARGDQGIHALPIIRVEFKIAILDDHDIASGGGKTRPQCATLAGVLTMKRAEY